LTTANVTPTLSSSKIDPQLAANAGRPVDKLGEIFEKPPLMDRN
jgi:hypothetical protein